MFEFNSSFIQLIHIRISVLFSLISIFHSLKLLFIFVRMAPFILFPVSDVSSTKFNICTSIPLIFILPIYYSINFLYVFHIPVNNAVIIYNPFPILFSLFAFSHILSHIINFVLNRILIWIWSIHADILKKT